MKNTSFTVARITDPKLQKLRAARVGGVGVGQLY